MSEKRWKSQYCGVCGKQGVRLVGCDPFCPEHPGAVLLSTPHPQAGWALSPVEKILESGVMRMI